MSSKDQTAGKGGKVGGSDTQSVTPSEAELIQMLKAHPEMARKIWAALQDSEKTAPNAAMEPPPRRAICLGGGGPAVGLHIGALEALKNRGVDFGNERSVWALSCIGAWAGVIYNQAKKGKEIETTYKFFNDIFRDDASFKSFPTNTIFAPDWAHYAEAIFDHLCEPTNYRNAFLPREIMRSYLNTVSYLSRRKNWRTFSEGDFNRWTLNDVLAVHPAMRFLTGLMYKTKVDGRARLFYEDSNWLQNIDFEELKTSGKPFIFHNAFNFVQHRIDLFANDPPQWNGNRHKEISASSLCACSALPFVEETVKVDDTVYCEGALVDTLNFKSLLTEHRDLEEIWINRIVDTRQVRKPENLHDALANLCELFAATVGEDDVKLFKYHVKENNDAQAPAHLKALNFNGMIIEIEVSDQINFHWSHENLRAGRKYGAQSAENTWTLYNTYKNRKVPGQVFMIPDDLSDQDIRNAGVPLSLRRIRQALHAQRPITADERARLSRP